MTVLMLLASISTTLTGLAPVSLSDLPASCQHAIQEAGVPLEGLQGPGDTTEVILEGDLPGLGHGYLVLLESPTGGLPGLVIFLLPGGTPFVTGFEATGGTMWVLWELKGIAAGDIDGDGYADLTIEADYMTGIGPEGAVPFPFTAVALWDPDSMAFLFGGELSD